MNDNEKCDFMNTEDFDSLVGQVELISSKEELFVVEDIENLITEKLFYEVNIYVLVKDIFNKNLVSSLSIVKYNNKIERFESTENLKKYLTEKNIPYPTNLKRKDLKIYDGKTYPIALVIEGKHDQIPDRFLDDLLYSLWDIVGGTINYDNLSKEHNQRKIVKLERKIAAAPNFNWEILCQFINEEEEIKTGYFQVSPHKEIDVDSFISDFKLPFLDELKEKSKTCKNYFKESILSGKPIVFFETTTTNYVAIIPAIGRYQAPKFVKKILILWSKKRIKYDNISNSKDYIDYYLRKRENSQKHHFLSEIQAEVIKKFNGKGYNNKNELLSDFKTFSEKCLRQIINTYAYSAVVRLCDVSTNTLVPFAVECNQWGKWDGCAIDEKKKNIKLKLHHCSVNAFVFKKAMSLEKPYVYIKNLKQPIPQEYKEIGLNNILLLRESSMSEICFPLFVGKVPFGVLNIESPISNAFDNDIHYLLSIKQAIESFYDISIKTTDSNWLAARSPVYKNIHEIKQLLDTEGFFDEKQLSELKPLILFENNVLNNEEKELDVLRQDIESYLERKINDLDKPYVVNLFYWDIKEKISVSNDEFTKVRLIVFNLIENIIKHSDVKKDTIDLSINTINKGHQILKIKVTTFGTFGADVFPFLTFSPILKQNKYHYGMFLVGMLSRNLGGTCYIEKKEKKDKKFTIIEIIIPLN